MKKLTTALLAGAGISIAIGATAYNHVNAKACNKLPIGLNVNCAVTHAVTNFLMPAANAAENWEYLAEADDGSLFFTGKTTKVGDQTIVKVKVTDDPKEGEYTYTEAFKCGKSLYKEDSNWKPIDPSKMTAWVYEQTCGMAAKQ